MEATGKLSKEGLSPKEFTATKEHATLDGGTFYEGLAYINATIPDVSTLFLNTYPQTSVKEEAFSSFRATCHNNARTKSILASI